MTALYIGSVTEADMCRVTHAPSAGYWSEEDERAPTMPPAPFVCVKSCGCGARFDADGWEDLALVGYQVVPPDDDQPEEDILEMRNCLCGSTLVLPVMP